MVKTKKRKPPVISITESYERGEWNQVTDRLLELSLRRICIAAKFNDAAAARRVDAMFQKITGQYRDIRAQLRAQNIPLD